MVRVAKAVEQTMRKAVRHCWVEQIDPKRKCWFTLMGCYYAMVDGVVMVGGFYGSGWFFWK